MVAKELNNIGNEIRDFIMLNLVNLVHVIFVGPLLVHASGKCKGATLKLLLFVLGIAVIVYHGYLMYKKTKHH